MTVVKLQFAVHIEFLANAASETVYTLFFFIIRVLITAEGGVGYGLGVCGREKVRMRRYSELGSWFSSRDVYSELLQVTV